MITVDNSFSSTLPDALARPPESAPVLIEPGEPVRLRIFVDRSVVEVVRERETVRRGQSVPRPPRQHRGVAHLSRSGIRGPVSRLLADAEHLTNSITGETLAGNEPRRIRTVDPQLKKAVALPAELAARDGVQM